MKERVRERERSSDDRNSREEWIVLQKQTARLRVFAVRRQEFSCRRGGERVLFDLPVFANLSFIQPGTLAVCHISLESCEQYFVT